jgi:hypothetical protein
LLNYGRREQQYLRARWRYIARHLDLCQLTRSRDVAGAVGFGKQPVVPDAMKAFRQDMDREAADELIGRERDCLVTG